MNSQLTQSLLQFSLWFAVASVLGVASYAAIMLTKGKAQFFFQVLCVFLVALPSGFLVFSIPIALFIALLCIRPASIERQIDGDKFDKNWYFLRYFAVVYQSVAFGWLIVILEDLKSQRFKDAGLLPGIALTAGFILTPLIITFLRWTSYKKQLRRMTIL